MMTFGVLLMFTWGIIGGLDWIPDSLECIRIEATMPYISEIHELNQLHISEINELNEVLAFKTSEMHDLNEMLKFQTNTLRTKNLLIADYKNQVAVLKADLEFTQAGLVQLQNTINPDDYDLTWLDK